MKRRACILAVMAAVGMLCSACRSPRGDAESAYLPLSEIQPEFGTLIATGNQPTRDQGGTGDRIGLFRDSAGFVWGLPISVSGDGTVRACAPMTLRGRNVTDDLPAGATIVGSTNAPTGWRGGTGNSNSSFETRGVRSDRESYTAERLTARPSADRARFIITGSPRLRRAHKSPRREKYDVGN